MRRDLDVSCRSEWRVADRGAGGEVGSENSGLRYNMNRQCYHQIDDETVAAANGDDRWVVLGGLFPEQVQDDR